MNFEFDKNMNLKNGVIFMKVTDWIISSCSTHYQKIESQKFFGNEYDVKEILKEMMDKKIKEWKEKHGENIESILATDMEMLPEFCDLPVESSLALNLYKPKGAYECEQVFYSAYQIENIKPYERN